MHTPIAYTYEADYHCPACAEAKFGLDSNGYITGIDFEGNNVGVVAPWDEWYQLDYGTQTLNCSNCGELLDIYKEENHGS